MDLRGGGRAFEVRREKGEDKEIEEREMKDRFD